MDYFTLDFGEKRARRWLDGDRPDCSPQSDDSDATLPFVHVPDPLPEEDWKRQRPDMFLSTGSATLDASKRQERATKDLGPYSSFLGRYRTQDGLITSRRLKGQARAGSTEHLSRQVARGGKDRIQRQQQQNDTWRNTQGQIRRKRLPVAMSTLAASIGLSILTNNVSAEVGRSQWQRRERSRRGDGHVRQRRNIPVSRVSSREGDHRFKALYRAGLHTPVQKSVVMR